MPVFSYQSELLNASIAASSALRMVVGVNGVSLWVQNRDKTLALKTWNLNGTDQGFSSVESELRSILGAERLLELPFETKICALGSAATTLVPRRLFDPENLDQYFRLLLRDNGPRNYGFEKLEAFDCYLVWAAEAGLMRLLEQYFHSRNISHIAGPLLRSFHHRAPGEGYSVFANLCGQSVQVAVFERGNLVFFNVFYFSKPSDLLYFILLVYKQFDLDPLELPLTLSGTLIQDSEIYRLLLRYFRTLHFVALPSGFHLPEEAKTMPPHFWFDLSTF